MELLSTKQVHNNLRYILIWFNFYTFVPVLHYTIKKITPTEQVSNLSPMLAYVENIFAHSTNSEVVVYMTFHVLCD